MNESAEDVRSRQVDAAIVAYFDALQRGEPTDLKSFLARHADIAKELEEYLADHGALERALPRLRAGASTDGYAGSTGRTGREAHLPPNLPRAFGKFELIDEIARGGMGVVFRARQATPQRIVALKMILSGQLASPEDIDRFYAEAHAAAALDHPLIVPIFEVGEHEGQHYFTMAFIEGQSLAQRLANGPLPAKDAATIIRDIALAVDYAHQHGVVHRDLKPANILFDTSGRARVTDFGLAKRKSDETGLTRTGQLLGTPSFMAPEQVAGDPATIGPVSDVYSLGATLYALLTGRPPFQAASTVDTLKQVLDQEPVAPRDLDATIPRDLETIVLKCLEKDRHRRYESAASLADDLGRFLAHQPVIARPATRAYRIKKFVRRNKVPVFAAAGIIAALVAGMAGTTVGLVGESRQRLVADTQRAEAKRQEKEAKEQAETALAVNRFLVDMLVSAHPENLGKDTTVREAVGAAQKSLDAGGLQDKPLVEASLRNAMGLSLGSLGLYEEAAANFRKADGLLRGALPLRHREIARNLNELGSALAYLGRFDEAAPPLREAVDICREALPAGDPDLATSLNRLGMLLNARGEIAEAEKLYREALAIDRKRGADDPGLIEAQMNLAALFTDSGRLSDAETLLRETLAFCRESLPAKHPKTSKNLTLLAAVLHQQGRDDKAEPLYRESLAILRDTLPEGHADIASCLGHLGLCLLASGNAAGAEPAFRESLEIMRAAVPPGHPDIATCLHNHALALQDQRKLPEAESEMRESCEILAAALPPDHPNLAASKGVLGTLLSEQGKFVDAEPIYREVLAAYVKVFGNDHLRVGNARYMLGDALAKLERFAEAESELVESERILASAEGDVASYVREQTITALVALYRAWDKSEPGMGHDAQVKQWQAKLPEKEPVPAAPQHPANGNAPNVSQHPERGD
jgi:tetratricopeptide (TPR) repeat protein